MLLKSNLQYKYMCVFIRVSENGTMYKILRIGGQAADIFLLLLLLLLSGHGSLWQPIECLVIKKRVKFGTLIQGSPMIPHSNFGVAGSRAVAPPTGQSWTCIHVYTF